MRIRPATTLFALALSLPAAAHAQVNVTIDSSQNVREISPYIYGSNTSAITNRTFDRAGGNRWTGYNWETNASNAGADWYHHSDFLLTNGNSNAPSGEAVRGMIQSTASRAALVTVPIAGYVAADGNGTVDESQVAPSSRWKQVVAEKGSPLSLTPNKTDGFVYTDEFVNWVEANKQSGKPVFYSLDNEPAIWGEPIPPGWNSGTPPVFNAQGQIIVPGIEPTSRIGTHPLIHPSKPTYTEMRDKTIEHASAIKNVAPDTLVFGGVGYGWMEFRSLQDAPGWVTSPSHPGGDQPGELHYYEYLLQQVRQAEIAQGRTLMDVLDLHWYPEATGGGIRINGGNTSSAVVAARVQAVRSLWDESYGYSTDPTLGENSWITKDVINGPIKLLDHVHRDINDFKPGTKIAITEYNYGAGSHISGAIAEADFLGVMGREGVYAASWWDEGTGTNFINSAFNMYLNYDGQGGQFGDTSVMAALGNPSVDNAKMAAYASVDQDDPNKMVVVLINRTNSSLTANLDIANAAQLNHAEVYQLAGASATIQKLSDIMLGSPNTLSYAMAPMSVTTLALTVSGDFDDNGIVDSHDIDILWNVIRPELAGNDDPNGDDEEDLNGDGFVNEDDVDYLLANLLTAGPDRSYGDADLDGGVGGLDFTLWRLRAGTGWANGDFDGDGGIGGLDFTLWRTRPSVYPSEVGPHSGIAAVPEPATCLLAVSALCSLVITKGRRDVRNTGARGAVKNVRPPRGRPDAF